jgi:D-3-phosphoglycerate dehydrogenase
MEGKVLGIIGMGRIGSKVAQKAASLGMRVTMGYDKFHQAIDIPNVKPHSLDEIFQESDFISVHTPFDPSHGPVIDKAAFEKMKKGVIIINCARGGVIDENALLSALNSGKVYGAVIDTWENEPKPRRDLVEHPRVIATPHIGAMTVEAQERVGGEIVEIVKEFFGL